MIETLSQGFKLSNCFPESNLLAPSPLINRYDNNIFTSGLDLADIVEINLEHSDFSMTATGSA